MEVDLQSCGTLFSLLPSDIKCQQKYVESLFRSPLVCSEFYALYFFLIFSGVVLLLYILFLCMDGSGIWTPWSVSLCLSFWLILHLHSEVCILTHFAFTAWFLTCEELKILRQRKFSSSQPGCSIHLGSWDCGSVCWEEMGWEVCCFLVPGTCTRSLEGLYSVN